MSWFQNRRLITKLTIPLVLLLVVSVGIVWISRSALTELEANTRAVVDVSAARALGALEMAVALNEATISENNVILNTDAAIMSVEAKSFQDSKRRAFTAADRLIDLADTQQRRETNQGIKASVSEYFNAAERSIALGMKNENQAALKISSEEARPARARSVAAVRARMTSNLADLDAAKLRASEVAEHAKSTLTTIAAAGLLTAFGLLGAIVVVGIAKPLASLVRVLDRMAQGETEAEIREASRGDEIGAVGKAVEGIKAMVAQKAAEQAEIKRIADEAAAVGRRRAMIELADGFEQAVGSVIGMVSSAATELQGTAQAMSATAGETASQSTTVAAAAEEAASNVNTVAAAAEELGSSVQEIGRQVGGSADLARMAVTEAEQTAGLVQTLSIAASEIGNVVALISSIAGQTNLLALNATIEAARAGEAGRGFAVVASEVKELASQTARATDEISTQIARIQGSTGQAVTAIDAITGRIREISGVATSLSAAVEEQGAATQEIIRNVSQAAMGTGEVTANIVSVASAADETGAAATQVLASASELSRQSEHLRAEVSRFLGTVRAA